MTTRRTQTARLAWTTMLAAALVLPACSKDGRSPTEPGPTSVVSWWSGSWTFDEASPAGDCLVDALNGRRRAGVTLGWPMALRLATDAGSVNIFFSHPGHGPGGFWPLGFAGTIDGNGVVRAAVGPSWVGLTRHDAWEELCHSVWTSVGGELSGTLSPDGSRLTGTVVEGFRVVPSGELFTIRSHFEATRR